MADRPRDNGFRGGGALAGATVAFDLDGTLVDTAPDIVAALNFALEAEGCEALPFVQGRLLIGGGVRPLIERGFRAAGLPASPERLAKAFDAFIARYGDHLSDDSRPYPGVVEALTTLKAGGLRLCVCTNKYTDLAVALLVQLGLGHFFDAVTGPQGLPAQKPDPRHLEAAIHAAGGDVSRAVMVGDAATDAGAARAAGLPLILMSYGYTETPAADLRPDILLDRFEDVPDAVLRLLAACSP
jgi:phosphoglycolate phosphatase